MTAPLAELDHLVVAAMSLEAGMAYLEPMLGVRLERGGQHRGYGTHNRLLSLGPDVYLELIAPDPGQADLLRPRPFSLDAPEVCQRIATRPRLVHYVCRTRSMDVARAAMTPWAAPPITMQRDELVWRITLPDDGLLPGGAVLGGVVPTLIDWGDTVHPCAGLPDVGVRLASLEVDAPVAVLRTLRGVLGDPHLLRVSEGEPALRARLSVDGKEVVLD